MISTIYHKYALRNWKFVAGEMFFRMVDAQILVAKSVEWIKQIFPMKELGLHNFL